MLFHYFSTAMKEQKRKRISLCGHKYLTEYVTVVFYNFLQLKGDKGEPGRDGSPGPPGSPGLSASESSIGLVRYIPVPGPPGMPGPPGVPVCNMLLNQDKSCSAT